MTWLSLVPPLIVVIAIFITHKLNISLILGIVSAVFIVIGGDVQAAVLLLGSRIIEHFSDIGNIYLYLSLIAISSLITLFAITGSAASCAQIIGKRVHTKKGIELSSLTFSFLLAIDDYLSILTVGFVTRPLTDRLAVARVKLAYIVHSLAGPLVVMVPISTWAATILVQLDNAGINLDPQSKIIADPFYVYLKTIPFMFYSLCTVFCVWFIVHKKISYGLMHQYEKKTIVEDSSDFIEREQANKHSLVELLVPFAILIGGVMFGMLYAGGYYVFGGTYSFFEALKHNNQTFLVLFIAGCSAFLVSFFISWWKKMVSFAAIPRIIGEGIVLMQSPIIMVILASILGSFLRIDLHTGSYIAYLLMGIAPLYLIPVISFIIALLITLVTGSAWGTFSLLIPITTQMLVSFLQLQTPVQLDQIALLFPTLGALLSGAVCGDHISPFSETTIMTGASTGIAPLEHARTQVIYAIPVIIATIIAFIIAGFLCMNSLLLSFGVSLCVGIIITAILLVLANKLYK